MKENKKFKKKFNKEQIIPQYPQQKDKRKKKDRRDKRRRDDYYSWEEDYE